MCLLRFKYISNLIGNYILINCCWSSYVPSYGALSCGLFYGPSYWACCVASSCGLFYVFSYGAYVGIIKLVFY